MSDEDSCRLRTDLRLPKILKLVIAVGFGHWQSNCFVGTRFFSNTSLDESVGKTELQQAVNRGASLGATCWSLGWPHCEQSYLLDLRRTANDVSSWVAIQGKSWQPRTGSPRVRGIEHPASRAKSASPDFSFSLQISARKAGRRAGREHLKNV
jgi:hypothetical protein